MGEGACLLALQKPETIQRNISRVGVIRHHLCFFIAQHPGVHLNKIAQQFHMSPSCALYHLSILEQNHHITSIHDKHQYYRRFYPKYLRVSKQDKRVLAVLRQHLVLGIVVLMMTRPTLRHREMAQHLGIAPSTLSYHLKKLLRHGILDVSYEYKKGCRYVLRNKDDLLKIIQRYQLCKKL